MKRVRMGRVRLASPGPGRVKLVPRGMPTHPVFKITSYQEYEDLRTDLRDAYRASLGSGGYYTVFRKHGDQIQLAIEIHVPGRHKSKRYRTAKLLAKEEGDE